MLIYFAFKTQQLKSKTTINCKKKQHKVMLKHDNINCNKKRYNKSHFKLNKITKILKNVNMLSKTTVTCKKQHKVRLKHDNINSNKKRNNNLH